MPMPTAAPISRSCQSQPRPAKFAGQRPRPSPDSAADYTASSTEDWHRTPGRQFSISMSGEIEVEVSDGKKHAIHAGDIVFLDDLQGKGHITRILTPVTNIFIRVPDGFDVVKWSRGEA